MTVQFSKKLILLVAPLLLLASSLFAQSPARTLVSKTEIPERCIPSYQAGLKAFQEYVVGGGRFDTNQHKSDFEKIITDSTEDDVCKFITSMALLDSLQTWQQQVVLEMQIDRFLIEDNSSLTPPQIESIYRPRLERLGIKWHEIETYVSGHLEEAKQATQTFQYTMQKLAQDKDEVVPFGRFVFIKDATRVFTAFDFKTTRSGQIATNKNREPAIKQGSYGRLGQSVFDRAIETAEEYLRWKPGLIYGEDSFLYGAFWRAIGVDDGPSIREIKETHFFSMFRREMNLARSYGFNIASFLKVYQHMINKQKAYLDRDIEGLKRVYYGALAAPFVPLGMAAGGLLLTQTGWFAATSMSTFSLAGGSFFSAANIAAASSLLTISSMAGLGGYYSIQNYRNSTEENPFRVIDALDQIVIGAVGAVPTAALVPVQVGLTALGAQSVWAAGRFLLSGGLSLGRAAVASGFRGSLSSIGSATLKLPGTLVRLPGFLIKKVFQTWYQNPKLLAIHYGVDVSVVVGYEVGYRQYALDGENKFLYTDENGEEKINHNALYSIAGTVVLSPLSKPLILIPSMGGRYMAYRSFSVFSSIITHLAISGQIDTRRIIFDQLYWGSIGTATGEVDRYVKLSSFVQNSSPAKQAALLILFKVLLVKPIETPMRIYFQDRFIRGDIRPIDEIKSLVKQSVALDLNEFTDEELEAAMTQAYSEIPQTEKPGYLK